MMEATIFQLADARRHLQLLKDVYQKAIDDVDVELKGGVKAQQKVVDDLEQKFRDEMLATGLKSGVGFEVKKDSCITINDEAAVIRYCIDHKLSSCLKLDVVRVKDAIREGFVADLEDGVVTMSEGKKVYIAADLDKAIKKAGGL